MFDILRELRLAARALRRRPGLTMAAMATLALTIGANTAVFSTAHSLLLKPLPFPEADRMMALWPDHFVSNREIEFLRRDLRSVDGVASVSPGWLMGLTGVETPVEVSAERVSGNLFELLGARPLMGRTFGLAAERVGAEPVVVLSHPLWRSQFASDPAVVGKSITLNGDSYQVTAVMPRGFSVVDSEADLWYPLTMDPTSSFYAGSVAMAFARLLPGTTGEQVDREFRVVAQRMGAAHGQPATYAADARAIGLKEQTTGPMRQTVLLLLAAAVFILAIGIANLANLLLVRTTERRTEFAVRASLGAGRGAIVRQLTIEAALLCGIGGALGIALGFGGVAWLRRMLPADTPRVQELGIGWTAIAVSAGLIILTVALVSIAPALVTSARQLAGQLRAGRTTTSASSRTRGILIMSQVALTVVLICGATLMLRTMAKLQSVDPGFRTERVLTMRVQPSFATGEADVRAFWRTLLPTLAALPGVDAAGTVLHLPMGGRRWNAAIEVEGRQLPAGVAPPRASWQSVDGEYFEAIGIPLLSGRAFTEADREGAPRVIVVNDAFARRILPGRDPIGLRIRGGNATDGEWATIIGIVGNVRHDSLSVEPAPEFYAPLMQNIIYATTIVLRTNHDPRLLATAAREAIWRVNRNVPISNVYAIDDVLRLSMLKRRAILNLLGMFAGVGLALGLVGIYGLVAYTVRQRKREIGIRMSLGAAPHDVLVLMTAVGARWALPGVAAGSLLAMLTSRYMASVIFGITPLDAVTFTTVPALMLLVSLGASYVPARRAANTNPALVLQD
ncbi:MAG: ABC transporter permease [Gemmatimonadota bacterium]